MKIDAPTRKIGASSPKADHDIVGAGNLEIQTYGNLQRRAGFGVAFIFDRGKIRALLLRPDREKPILASSQE